MNRRDLLLQEMGMTQWQLRHPERLKGVVNIHVAAPIRLIIITDSAIKQDTLLQDVLRSLMLEEQHYLLINFQQTAHLNITHPLYYWLLSNQTEIIEHTLPLCQSAEAIWQSPDWSQFKQNHHAKRQLWQQIQASNYASQSNY
ncbi:DNA polymerase III subunit psi [Pasteurella sp. P03HT]